MLSHAQYTQFVDKGYSHIPLVQEVLADLDTPLSLYLKLANQPYTYLLESVVGGERFGRYSFIGLPSDTYIKVWGNKIEYYEAHQLIETTEGDPLDYLEHYQAQFSVPDLPNLPRFTGGLVGYFSYETIHYFEHKLGQHTQDKNIEVPDILLMLSRELAVVDNLSGKIYLIVYADTQKSNAYFTAKNRLEDLRIQLRQNPAIPYSIGSPSSDIEHETDEPTFCHWVEHIKNRILAGDCMQVVPSVRMKMAYSDHPISFYRALRTINPSPYLIYYHFDDFFVVGSSPEILVRREQDTVTVRPLAGTRKRGATPEEDKANEIDLLQDSKEIAEHVMLIDLGRNDVGKIAKTASVSVTEKMTVERYSHVMHIVSNVEGQRQDGMSNISILKATLPAGTLSGAPKLKAMEIIESLEPSERGIYGGAIGYLGFNQDMDLAIAIRTAVIKDKTLYIQSGAGIVADSDPQSEWQETQNKAMALIRAGRMVEKGLDT